MEVNFVRLMYLILSFYIGLLGFLINYVEPHLPLIITRTYRFGKFGVTEYHPLVAKTEVRKSGFKHTYYFAAPAGWFTLSLCFYKYLCNGSISNTIYWMLDTSLGANRQSLVSAESTLLAVTLLAIHASKRLYESVYVNVFSDKTMHISHYLAGFMHYGGAFMCLIGESMGFVRGSRAIFSWERVTSLQLTCAVIILLLSYVQHNDMLILRNLRKNEDGAVVSTGYKIPHGGLFEYISGALQFSEILIYIGLSIILWQWCTFHYVTLWVILNQVECAILTHQWYKKTFKNYPKTRKIVIPYLY